MIDGLVFTGYVLLTLVTGALARRREDGKDNFFLAGRSMGALPIGLSVMITLFTAINFSALPTEVIGHGLYVLVALPVFLLVAWPVSRWMVPFFRNQEGMSGYAWLETRYDGRVRRTAAGLFLLWRMAWMATALFAAGQIIAPMTGVPSLWIMSGALVLALAYILWGGLRAVIYTDVLQFAVLFGGLVFAVVYTLLFIPGDLPGWVNACLSRGLFQPWVPLDPSFWSLDPTIRISFWSGILGTFVAFLARYGADQMVLQRYVAARSLQAAQRGIWINAWAAVCVLFLLALLGLTAGATEFRNLSLDSPARLAEFFRSLPPGISGLVTASLLAATMSSLDSGIHACCLTLAADFSREGDTHLATHGYRRVLPVLMIGVLVLVLTFPLRYLGGLFAIVNKIINGLGSPLLAIVLLAIWRRGVTSRGLCWGGIMGFAASGAFSLLVDHLALHYYAVVNLLMTVVLCFLISAMDRLCGYSMRDTGHRKNGQTLAGLNGTGFHKLL